MEQAEIISGLAKTALEKYAEPIAKSFVGAAKKEWEKFTIDFDIVFSQYLKKAAEKYSKVKTILYRTEPKYIYNFFECPTLMKGRSKRINGNDVNNILDESHFIIIQGTGGIGKSTLLKHLFLNELSKKDLIPIFIELKDINSEDGDISIRDFIFKRLDTLGSTIKLDNLDYALDSGCFLFFFDGYDEISSEKKDPFFKELDAFCDRYTNNYFILTTRPYSDFVEFQRFTILNVCNLTKEQAISLIQKLEFDQEIKQHFVTALDDKLYESHISFASNPLLLNIMLLTYDNYAEIPQKLHLFYSNAFETLYAKHDATKAGYRRELKCSLSYDSFKKVFSYFCFLTYLQNKIEFTYDDLLEALGKVTVRNVTYDKRDYIDDLVNSLCVLYKDGLKYKFTHRSFQEYFTALFLKELPDANMQQMGLHLIMKDPQKAKNDNTFMMLYDMTEERVEQNILLPLLDQFEESCTGELFDFYFSQRDPVFRYGVFGDEDDKIDLAIKAESGNPIVLFLSNFLVFYVDRNKKALEKMDAAADTLLKHMQTEHDYEIEDDFCGTDFMDDPIVYELMKETWVGDRINILCNLKSIIKGKKKEAEFDLSSLLVV